MRWNVFKGENWMGCVVADSHEEARKAADANPDFNGWTSVELREEPLEPHGRA